MADAATRVRTRVRLMRTGTIAMPRAYVYRGEGHRRDMLGVGVAKDAMLDAPIGAFLVEHPREGPILVDTGISATPNLGRAMSLVFRGLRMDPGEAVTARLSAWGIAREDVRTVVMTHLHVDHTSAMGEFPGATFVTTRAEWDAAHERLAIRNGYVGAHLPAESSMRFVDFSGGDVDLLGDGTIRLVSTPGHSVGHLSVLVEAENGPLFILGDAVYTLRNLREDILPLRTADDAASRESMQRLRAYAEAHPGVPLVPTHDAAVWDALGAAS